MVKLNKLNLQYIYINYQTVKPKDALLIIFEPVSSADQPI